MPEALKNVYSAEFINQLTSIWKTVLPQLNENQFANRVFISGWEKLELKQRMSHLADVTIRELPKNFKKSAPIIGELMNALVKANIPVGNFEYMFIPEIVLKLGIDDLEESFLTIEHITTYSSCEFAIRPFILKYEAATMDQMLKWSKHKHENVRRLASEGCRSRLPWSMALPKFKKDASLIVPILENLKEDESLFVRKSVANNLNDISKDLPYLALQLANKWYGHNKNSNWIVKHGLRTLLKAGNPESMIIFGYSPINKLTISELNLTQEIVQFGKELHFKCSIKNKSTSEGLIRLEYFIHLLKQNGTQTKKIFKLTEKTLAPNETLDISKNHQFKAINTRKYYPGMHAISLVVNGIEFKKQPFLLNM